MSNTAAANDSSTSYQYEPLTRNSGEIRVVKITGLQQDAETDSIVLELDILHTPLNQATRYLAISYAWGNPARTRKLLVNGAPLLVPENTFHTLYTVYHALPTVATGFRLPGEQFPLWIDAVCLNQSDVKEKDEQVRRMGQIYSQATGTIGYIGRHPEGKNPFDGFRTLLWIGNDVGFKIRDGVTLGAAYAWFEESNRDPYQFEQEVGPVAEFAEAYQTLFSSDWFLRCWVTQEVALARDVFCLYGHGSDFAAIALETLATLLRGCEWHKNTPHLAKILLAMKPESPEASSARNRIQSQVGAWSRIRHDLDQGQAEGLRLLELLEKTRFGKATDPRDRIYSLMGMMKEHDRSVIRVDYSDIYTAENVFLDVAAHCLVNSDGHRLLCWAGLRPGRILTGLPSWAPDWSVPNAWPLLSNGLYGASGTLAHPLTLQAGGRRISARGIPVDAITFVTPPIAPRGHKVNMVSVLDFAAQLCHRLQKNAIATGSQTADTYLFNDEPWYDVMWRTCCIDRLMFPDRRAIPADRQSFVACLERYGFGGDALNTIALDGVTKRVPVDKIYFDDIGKQVEKGFEFVVSVFQTEKVFGMTGRQGLIGSFPDYTREGDIVVLLLGQELPVVLRPLGDAENGFKLVGMCYVHGIMDGEWVKHVTDGQGEERSEVFQDFVIH